MKEFYYYARDNKNRPVVTVCLLQDDGNVARGVAICSLKDGPNKAEGRKIARKRASAALHSKGRCDCGKVERSEPVDIFWGVSCPFPHHLLRKAVFNPELTEFEREILKIKEAA